MFVSKVGRMVLGIVAGIVGLVLGMVAGALFVQPQAAQLRQSRAAAAIAKIFFMINLLKS